MRDNREWIYPQLIGATCYDIGAHIGDRTIRFLQLGAARIVAVEPQKKIYLQLANRFVAYQNVIAIRAACGRENGAGIIRLCGGPDTLATLSDDWRKRSRFKTYNFPETETVNIVTLDSLIAEHGAPDYLKVDVEGSEPEVFAGLSIAPAWVCFEYVAELRHNLVACLDRLSSLGDYEYSVTISDVEAVEIPWTDNAGVLAWLDEIAKPRPLMFGNVIARIKHEQETI